MRLLFAKHSLVWPRSSGHDVHTFYMMKACAALGHEVSLATVVEPEGPAIDGLPLQARVSIAGSGSSPAIGGTWLQRKYRSFWGVPEERIAKLAAAARDLRADAVVVVGLDALPYFPGLRGTTRVWYAADEWVLHHLSQIKWRSGTNRENLRSALIKGVYERAHRGVVDRVWVVAENDRRAMRRLAGMRGVDVLPNGVDGDFFRPGPEPVQERSAVFWGRLDFGPNIQALEWFCGKVWPIVRARVPDASFTIIGFQPTDAVRALASAPGITLTANLRDLRSSARSHAAAVLPLVSGAGIKNKLLEAAALGLPVVCTPLATGGLRGQPPLLSAAAPDAFAAHLVDLWRTPGRREELGAAMRSWVVTHHTWDATARDAMAALQAGGGGR